MLRQQLEAAQMREQAALEREREAREERQAGREREALLLRLVEQTQQRYDRLLDMPRTTPLPRPEPGPHSAPNPAGSTLDPLGDMRRRIVALLREHPDGLTPAEMRTLLDVDKSLADTCLGMLRDGLVQRVGPGRHSAIIPSQPNEP